MKKLLSAVVAGCMIFAAAGQALASFEEGHLILTVYNNDAQEVGYDLGDVSDLVYGTAYGAGSIDLSNYDPAIVTGLSDLNAGVYAYEAERVSNDGWEHYYYGSPVTYPEGEAPEARVSAVSSYVGAVNYPRSAYQTGDTDNDGVVVIENVDQQYAFRMNNEGTSPGSYNNLPRTYLEANEGRLAWLESNDYLEMYVYEFNYMDDDRQTEDWSGMYGEAIAIVRLHNDGSIEVASVSAVPIPGSIFLLGTGLLGLIGVRRKNA